jgi:hypothetical protein
MIRKKRINRRDRAKKKNRPQVENSRDRELPGRFINSSNGGPKNFLSPTKFKR